MKYQMVVQFRATSKDDFNHLIGFEQNLSKALSGSAVVDGHDFGSGEFNIFVLTDDPAAAFERVRKVSAGESGQEHMRVAYREVGGEAYSMMWPPDLKEFSVS
jgi:hypothetical protein